MMNPSTNPLEGLRDIHMPDPVSFWPLAPGWWLALLGLIATALLIHFVMRTRKRSPKRAALCELEQLEADYSLSGDATALASGLSSLLRRVSLLRSDRSQIASAHGEARARLLSAGKTGFSSALVSGIEKSMYQNTNTDIPHEDALAWLDATRGFIRRSS